MLPSYEKPKFSLGVDIGTSYSCISLCDLEQDPPYRIIKFYGKGDSKSTGIIPSIILYNSEGRAVAIGEEALDTFLSSKSSKNDQSAYSLVREFKAQFNRRFFVGNEKPIEYEEAYEEFFRKLFDVLKTSLDMKEGRVCVTHPARKKQEDNIGPRIIDLAGRVLGDGFEVEGLDEASALVQFLDREEGFLSVKPRKILVIDSGGGTTDFAFATAAYNLFGGRSPLEIEFTDRTDFGGRNIDQALYQKAQEQSQSSITDPVQKEKNLKDLKDNKEKIDWSEPEKFKFSIPVGNRKIRFTREKFLQTIEPILISSLKPILTMTSMEELDLIVLAGGNSLLPPLKSTLEKLLEESKIEFKYKPRIVGVKREDVKTAVSKGASLYINRTNRQLRFRLGYSVSIIDKESSREKVLWKQGDSFPSKNHRYIEKIIQNPANAAIKMKRGKEGDLIHPLTFLFTEPVDTKSVRAYFEIDDNGYLRYHGEPFGKKNRSRQEIIRQFLFETTQPGKISGGQNFEEEEK